MMPATATRAAPMDSEEAPSGAKACIVPVVPQHIPAPITHRVPFKVLFDIFMLCLRIPFSSGSLRTPSCG